MNMVDAEYDPEKLPEVHDEAADTPRWLPILGIAVAFALLTVFAISASKDHHHTTTLDAESEVDGN